jgi:hypothetical protein
MSKPSFLNGFFYENQPAHCSYRPLISKKQILIANDPYAAKYYLSIPIGLIGVNRDITVRKRAEEALEDSQEDKSGKKQETTDVGIRLALTANAPVFSFLETMIGNGIVGGNVPRAELYGKKTAKTALRLLKGEQPIECCFYLILACRAYEV